MDLLGAAKNGDTQARWRDFCCLRLFPLCSPCDPTQNQTFLHLCFARVKAEVKAQVKAQGHAQAKRLHTI